MNDDGLYLRQLDISEKAKRDLKESSDHWRQENNYYWRRRDQREIASPQCQ